MRTYRILVITWACFGQDDALSAFHHLGHEVYMLPLSDNGHVYKDGDFEREVEEKISELKPDLVFSFNFFPMVAQVCRDRDCRYLSWIYDNPYSKVFYPEVRYETNYVFTFDSSMCEYLRKQGVQTVYYMPLAVNSKRMRALKLTEEDRRRFTSEVSFVGALYNEKHNFFERLCAKLDPHTVGYLEAVVLAQTDVYGCNLMKKCMTADITDKIDKVMPYGISEGFLTSVSHLYVDYYLARKVTNIERTLALELLSERFQTYLYTLDEKAVVGNAVNKGIIDYNMDMPKVFRCSKINLCPTLKSIYTGIPLRAMDIMGSGGFLLTNFQEDFFRHFEPDKEFVYYTGFEEMVDKADYYLSHEEEREKICNAALERVSREHTYEIRLSEMLQMMDNRQ